VRRVQTTVTELALATTQTLPSVQALLRAADSGKRAALIPPGAGQRMVLFGGSTGAPGAMIEVLRELPKPFAAPIVIAQHIAAGFVGGMADWLTRDTGHKVGVAKAGEIPQPGRIYLLPVPKGLKFTDDFCFAAPRMAEVPVGRASISPSIDLLFSSAAQVDARSVIAVLFSGMGRDGVKGMRSLLVGGAIGMVQDPLTCVVPGIPGAAIEMQLDVLSQDTRNLGMTLRNLTQTAVEEAQT